MGDETQTPSNKVLKSNDFKFNDKEEGMKSNFKPYSDIIQNLTRMYTLETGYDIISVTLSHNSEVFIVVLMVSDEHYKINLYDRESLK